MSLAVVVVGCGPPLDGSVYLETSWEQALDPVSVLAPSVCSLVVVLVVWLVLLVVVWLVVMVVVLASEGTGVVEVGVSQLAVVVVPLPPTSYF